MEKEKQLTLVEELREFAGKERKLCEEYDFPPAYADTMERAADRIEYLNRIVRHQAARIINGIIDSDVAKNYDGSALEEADKHIEMLEGDVERLNRENMGQSVLINDLQDDLRRVTRERDALLEDVKGGCNCCGNADAAMCWMCLKRIFWKWRGVQKKEG